MEQPKSDPGKVAVKFEKAVGRICICGIMILLPLLLLDYISPLFWFHRRSEIERKFPVQIIRQPKPYVMFGGAQNGSLRNSEELNNLGYRGKTPLVPKEPNEFRIFMLGGSTVFRGNPPLPAMLEEEFRKNDKGNVKVYNFGVVSAVSSMELSRIVFEISELQPDLIVMYNGANDILHPYTWDPRPGYPFNFIVYENNPLLESDVRSYPTFNLFLYGSNLARSFFPHHFVRSFVPLKEERQKVNWGSNGWRNEIAGKYITNLAKARKISHAFGARFIAFFQPMVYYKDSLSIKEKTHRWDENLKDHCICIRSQILAQVKLCTTGSDLILIDLSDIYDDTPTKVFIDEAHTLQESKDVITKAIYEHIFNNVTIE